MHPLPITKGKTKYEYTRKHAEKLFILWNQASVVIVLPGFVQQHCREQWAAPHSTEAFGAMAGCTNPRAECSAQASVINQPVFLLTAVQHSGLGEDTVIETQVTEGTLWRVIPMLLGS